MDNKKLLHNLNNNFSVVKMVLRYLRDMKVLGSKGEAVDLIDRAVEKLEESQKEINNLLNKI